jgi:hypothetical protein
MRKRPGFEWAGMLARDGSGVGVGICGWVGVREKGGGCAGVGGRDGLELK